VTDKKEKVSSNVKYNKEKREPLFRVEISSADTAEEAEKMRRMKADLIDKSGTAKQGVVDMYKFAKENGYFVKLKFDTGAHKKK
jgi:hypothetical protein